MRILHLTGDREDYGGITSVLRNLDVATHKLGWEHVVWVNQAYVEKRQPPLTYRYSKHICGDSANHWQVLFQAARAFGELRQLLKQEKFDVIHAHSRGTLLVALGVASRLNRPVVFTNHNYARRIGLYRWAAQRKHMHTVLLTPNMAKYYGLEAQPPRISVISSCCADGLFDEPLVECRTDTNGPLRLIGIGTLFRWKRWHLVAQALMQLAETERNRVEFSLWGPTPADAEARQYESELKEAIKRNRLERQFFLRGPYKSLTTVLREADWMIHPATNEPCGVALIEALALGLPAVVSDSGGPADIVQPGKTGLLFPPDNPGVLADQLRRILRGKVVMSPPVEIRESVRHRSASGVVKDYEQLYGHLLKSSNSQ